MATIYITDQITIGLNSVHNSTDWQIASDINFTNILAESIGDTNNLLTWNATLRNPDGTLFDVDYKSYARARAKIDGVPSPWFLLPTCGRL